MIEPSAIVNHLQMSLLRVASWASCSSCFVHPVRPTFWHGGGDQRPSGLWPEYREPPLAPTVQLLKMAPPDARGPGFTPFDAADVRALAAEARRGNRPDPAELDRLLEAASRGDRRAQESLLNAHLDWVASAADERRDRGLSEGDLFQEGALGLMEAIRGLGATGGGDFEIVSRREIAVHMDRALAREEAALRESEQLVRAAEDYERTEIGLRQELGREVTTVELAEKLEWTRERTEQVARLVEDARRRHDEELLGYLDPADPEDGRS
jgi:DNA-directed RNA polymerase sigma subunit (sigma70/sigma32)